MSLTARINNIGIIWLKKFRIQYNVYTKYSIPLARALELQQRMFWRMPTLLRSGLSLLCSAWVRHCSRLLVEVVDWRAIRLVGLICCQIILTALSPGSLLIWSSLACHPSPRLTTFAFRSSEVGCLLIVRLRPLWWHPTRWVCFLSILRELLMFWPPS